jgi:hypothetical protein
VSLCGKFSWLFKALNEVFLFSISGDLQEFGVEVSGVSELRLITPFGDVSFVEG